MAGLMTIEDDIAFLEQVPTLGLLGRDALRILAIGAEERELRQGEVLFTAGDASDGAYIVQRGRLLLSATGEVPGGEMTVGRHALVGEHALLTETRRPVTATALEPALLLRISRSLFRKMLEGFPETAVRLRDYLAARTERAGRDLYAVRMMIDPDAGKPGRG